MSILIFIIILSFLVIIHELGHYLVAKKIGVKVEEFGLGYPPRALRLFRKWGTDFTLNWIPFGGFVKMKGEFAEEDQKQAAKDDFTSKPALGRLAVILAGATVNFLYGVIAFSLLFSFLGIPTSKAIVSSVQPGSEAERIGLPTQVQIVKVQIGEEFTATPTFSDVSALLRAHAGEKVTLITQGPCERGECQENVVQYQAQLAPPEAVTPTQGPLGVAFQTEIFYPWYEMPFRGAAIGIEQAVLLGWAILTGLGTMMTNLITQGVVPAEVAGPVGIVHEAQRSGLFTQGLTQIIIFSGMLSINLAIMNVLPIPALDGGRAAFILLEKIIGKKRVARIEGYANYGGFALLIVLIVLVTARDVSRIFTS